jgi:hypothetical protein
VQLLCKVPKYISKRSMYIKDTYADNRCYIPIPLKFRGIFRGKSLPWEKLYEKLVPGVPCSSWGTSSRPWTRASRSARARAWSSSARTCTTSPIRCVTNQVCHQTGVSPIRCVTNQVCHQSGVSPIMCVTNQVCHLSKTRQHLNMGVLGGYYYEWWKSLANTSSNNWGTKICFRMYFISTTCFSP